MRYRYQTVADQRTCAACAELDWTVSDVPVIPAHCTNPDGCRCVLREEWAMNECAIGEVHRVRARNFEVAVYVGEGKFIGIRHKFGTRYIDAEWHYDTGAPYGTVTPERLLGKVPDGMDLREHTATLCASCNAPAHWDETRKVWLHDDAAMTCSDLQPRLIGNDRLFQELERWQS